MQTETGGGERMTDQHDLNYIAPHDPNPQVRIAAVNRMVVTGR